MKKNKHWYKDFAEFCPACGREDKWTQACYGDKPKDRSERFQITSRYCGFCLEYGK